MRGQHGALRIDDPIPVVRVAGPDLAFDIRALICRDDVHRHPTVGPVIAVKAGAHVQRQRPLARDARHGQQPNQGPEQGNAEGLQGGNLVGRLSIAADKLWPRANAKPLVQQKLSITMIMRSS